MQILVVASYFFVNGAQNAQFSFRIFFKISDTLKAHISGTEADINKRKSFLVGF